MSGEIVSSASHAQCLKEKYLGFEIPSYKLREWFSKVHKIFFDCDSADKHSNLESLLKNTDLGAFVIFFVVKEANGSYKFMDASFRNLGTETLERFITRYHQQLESMTKLSLQSIGLEYVDCVGYSYQERAT